MADNTEALLKILIRLMGRVAYPEENLYDIVCHTRASAKQLKAYNLCDGTQGMTAIAKKCGIDPGGLSRTISRWEDQGIVYRIGDGKDVRIMHIYPLSNAVEGRSKAVNK